MSEKVEEKVKRVADSLTISGLPKGAIVEVNLVDEKGKTHPVKAVEL